MNARNDMTNGETVTTGGIGTGAAIAAWWVSNLPTINGTLQTLVLLAGLVVSGLTVKKLLRKKSK